MPGQHPTDMNVVRQVPYFQMKHAQGLLTLKAMH